MGKLGFFSSFQKKIGEVSTRKKFEICFIGKNAIFLWFFAWFTWNCNFWFVGVKYRFCCCHSHQFFAVTSNSRLIKHFKQSLDATKLKMNLFSLETRLYRTRIQFHNNNAVSMKFLKLKSYFGCKWDVFCCRMSQQTILWFSHLPQKKNFWLS